MPAADVNIAHLLFPVLSLISCPPGIEGQQSLTNRLANPALETMGGGAVDDGASFVPKTKPKTRPFLTWFFTTHRLAFLTNSYNSYPLQQLL
jgi:hypothetical protein